MTEPKYFLLKPAFYPDADQHPKLLGRIVKNIEEPQGIFTPPRDSALYENRTYLNSSVLSKALGSFSHSKHAGLAAKIESLFKAEGHKESEFKFDFKTKAIRSIRIEGYDDVFAEFMKNDAVKFKLRDWYKENRIVGLTAFIIVGVLTWEDADVKTEKKAKERSEIEATLPIRQTLCATVGGLPPGNEGNPSVERNAEESEKANLSGRNRGTNIFAILYKVVRRSPLSSENKFKDKNPPMPFGRAFAGKESEEKEVDEEQSDVFELVDDLLVEEEVADDVTGRMFSF